jgi:predicted secreted protein
MATYTGKSGVIKISDGPGSGTLTAVAEVRSFTLDSTMDTIENTRMETALNSRTYVAGLETSTFTAEILYSAQEVSGDAAVAIPALLLGQEAGTFELYPSANNDAANGGSTKISGSCLVTGYSISSSFDDMVTATISAQVTGGLAYTLLT